MGEKAVGYATLTHPTRWTMKILETSYKCVFGASAILVVCYVAFMYWRIYQIYQRAGERVERIGFLWFSVYVQSPLSVSGAKIFEGLPHNIQAQVATFRLRTRRVHVAVVLWIFFLILLASLAKSIFA